MVDKARNRIPEKELLAYRAEVKGEIFRKIRQRLRSLQTEGFTQKDLADRLGTDPGLLSRRLKGEQDMRLETLSDLASGLGCRIGIDLMPLNPILHTDAQAAAQGFASSASERVVQIMIEMVRAPDGSSVWSWNAFGEDRQLFSGISPSLGMCLDSLREYLRNNGVAP